MFSDNRVYNFFSKISRRKKDVILIYQVGKVASISIQNSIEKSINREKADLFRIHNLTPEAKEESIGIINNPNSVLPAIHSAKLFLKDYEKINRLLSKNDRKILIITGVRDIVSLSISAVFQNIEILFPSYKYFNHNKKDASEIMRKIYFQILKNDKKLSAKHKGSVFNQTKYFYEREIKNKFDINVYDYPFNKDLGYQIINKNNIYLFIYKFEKLEQVFPKIEGFVSDYLNSNIFLKHDNAGKHKNYSELYKYFKDNIRFPQSELDYCYKNKYSEHFYSESEINSLYGKYIHNN